MKSPFYQSTFDVRENFQRYFEKQGHTRIASSSLIPHNDPTLLFTNAGMNQFKDCFLGVDKRPYVRATTAQKCVRAGGKHNDLENVGFTSRHHTFFEMLGNFSFGDYFKKDAIHFAWEFVTKVIGLPKDRLRVSVYVDDDESADIWHKQEGVPLERIVRFKEDNFWAMGDTGPCGPCSEIFWDQGKEVDGERWLEFWNCVFMQFDRSADGKLTPLPKPAVDTGMGLERMAAILQGAPSNYDIDLFTGLISSTQHLIAERTKKKIQYEAGVNTIESAALRVIVDHLRSTSFLLADGVLPSNEGRGYVLRRILRRAVRFGKRLGLEEPFLGALYPALMDSMAKAYPELQIRKQHVIELLTLEEQKFFETLDKGLHLLEESFSKMGSGKILPAEVVFKLYDTYGFPVDLTALIAREKNLGIDEAGLKKLTEQAQERSRASWKGSGDTGALGAVKEWKNQKVTPKFTGYDSLNENARVLAVAEGEKGAWVAIDPCPFYGEGGGQVGDTGTLSLAGKPHSVVDAQKPYDGGIALFVEAPKGTFKAGQTVSAVVNADQRRSTRANHTATHLLHAALRQILGKHVEQAGSLVGPEKLRFDFSHSKALTREEIEKIENWVNSAIEKDVQARTEVTSYDDAIKKGAIALFGEKYGDSVRMLQIPGLSTELCGGTHVAHTGEIRLFKIVSESAVAAGTRRIEGITGSGAFAWYRERDVKVEKLAQLLKSAPDQIEDRVTRLLEQQKELDKEITKLKQKLASGSTGAETLKASFKGMPLEVHVLENADAGFLRQKGDAARKQNPSAIHVVLSKPIVLVTSDTDKLPNAHAGNLLKDLAAAFGGRGGGQAQTAQGQLPNIKEAQEILAWASKHA